MIDSNDVTFLAWLSVVGVVFGLLLVFVEMALTLREGRRRKDSPVDVNEQTDDAQDIERPSSDLRLIAAHAEMDEEQQERIVKYMEERPRR